MHGQGGHERYLEMVRLRRRRRARHVAVAAWLIGAALFVAGTGYAVLARDRVVTAWPETASAYRQLGLEVNRFGVDFENIQRSRELDGTTPVLKVSADVRNITARAREAPDVRVGLLDEFDRELAFLIADVEPDIIAPGETGRFRALLENPPADSYRVDLRFRPRGEARNHKDGPVTTANDTAIGRSETLAATEPDE